MYVPTVASTVPPCCRAGADDFLLGLLNRLRFCARKLGFEAAAGMSGSDMQLDILSEILWFLSLLPKDRVHFMLVSLNPSWAVRV